MTPREQQQAKRIRDLLDRVVELENKNEELERLLLADVPDCFGAMLTRTENIIVGVLLKRNLVSKSTILATLYSDRADDTPEEKIADVFICKIRKKLSPYGVNIETVWGMGWRLDEESKRKITDLSRLAA